MRQAIGRNPWLNGCKSISLSHSRKHITTSILVQLLVNNVPGSSLSWLCAYTEQCWSGVKLKHMGLSQSPEIHALTLSFLTCKMMTLCKDIVWVRNDLYEMTCIHGMELMAVSVLSKVYNLPQIK